MKKSMLYLVLFVLIIWIVYKILLILPVGNRAIVLGPTIALIGTMIVLLVTTQQTRAIQKKAAEDLERQREREDRKFRYQEIDNVLPILATYTQSICKYYWDGRHKKNADRTEAVLAYYHIQLKIMSHDIEGGNVLKKLKTVHDISTKFYLDNEILDESIDELYKEFANWAKKYKLIDTDLNIE